MTKRKRLIPVNIATMTEKEHWAWVCSLTDEQHDRVAEKTYTVIEYAVSYIDEHGDSQDVNHYDTETEARKEFSEFTREDNHVGAVACVLERRTKQHNVIDHDLEDQEYDKLATSGDLHALTAGGWIDPPDGEEAISE